MQMRLLPVLTGLGIPVFGLLVWITVRPMGAGAIVVASLVLVAACVAIWLMMRGGPEGKRKPGQPPAETSEVIYDSRRIAAALQTIAKAALPEEKLTATLASYRPASRDGFLLAGDADPDTLFREQLRQAWQAGAMQLAFDPVVALPTRRLGFEVARLRVTSNEGFVLNPDRAVSVAIAEGLMPDIDRMLVGRACWLLRGAALRSTNKLPAILTISGASWNDPVCFTDLFQMLRDAAPTISSSLTIGVRQHDLMAWRVPVYEAIARLAELGYHMALDGIEDMELDFSELGELRFVTRFAHCPSFC